MIFLKATLCLYCTAYYISYTTVCLPIAVAVHHVLDVDANTGVLIMQDPVLHNSVGFGCSVGGFGATRPPNIHVHEVPSGSFLPCNSAQGMCLDQPNVVVMDQYVT